MNPKIPIVLLPGWLALWIATTSLAQGAAPPVPSPAETEKAIELSPFNVIESTDGGYLAENTLAGSRLNTRLRDTAGSVSVFNKEFIEDIGLTNIRDLLEYTVNSALGSNEESAENQNAYVNGAHLSGVIIMTRGSRASPGLDYFRSITPSDPYRVARYEDSRGPNAILFGIGGVGGMFNQSSLEAETSRNRARARYGVGSWDRNRVEVEANKVLLKEQLAVAIAAVDQQNAGWRQHDFQDKRRVYGTVTLRPAPELTVKLMGETGRDVSAVLQTFTASEQVLAWYDNRQARGVSAVTFAPASLQPTAALRAVGVTGLNVAATGLNHRFVYLENDGTFFDSRGSYLTGTYNDSTVRAPDGTPGVTGSVLRLNEPAFFPYHINASGPGMFRDQSLRNYTVSADWMPTRNIIGTDSSRREITGKVVTNNDLMMRYTRKFKGLPGRVSFQINITNLFDQTDIIPIRLSTSGTARDGYELPGGRGRAYTRFDLVAPREVRFTTTYSL